MLQTATGAGGERERSLALLSLYNFACDDGIRLAIWSDDLEAWTMDFHGRVKLASKKNFLLVSENAPKDVLMLFGKVAKTHFSLDYRAPLSSPSLPSCPSSFQSSHPSPTEYSA